MYSNLDNLILYIGKRLLGDSATYIKYMQLHISDKYQILKSHILDDHNLCICHTTRELEICL